MGPYDRPLAARLVFLARVLVEEGASVCEALIPSAFILQRLGAVFRGLKFYQDFDGPHSGHATRLQSELLAEGVYEAYQVNWGRMRIRPSPLLPGWLTTEIDSIGGDDRNMLLVGGQVLSRYNSAQFTQLLHAVMREDDRELVAKRFIEQAGICNV